MTLRSGKQIEAPTPAPTPAKFHSTPEKEDELAASKRKCPNQEGTNKKFHAGQPFTT